MPSISDSAKKRGRPKTTGTGQTVGVRLLPDLIADIDRFEAEECPGVGRPEAIRRLVIEALEKLGIRKPQ